MSNIIEIKHLKKTYDSYKKEPGLLGSLKGLFSRTKIYVDAVKSINLQIREGELVGFIGPNGAGKTTTLKMLSGILHPASGEARVMGFVPWERKKEYLRQISLVMGNKEQLWWDLPAIDSFLLNQKIYEIPENVFQKNVDRLSEMLEIKDILNVQVRKLSLGQRMKAELALALLHNPKVLFLDEPTIGLDVVSQKNIREFLRQYNREQKTTIILSSHYMDDIKELAGRVVTIDHGQIIYDGTIDELIKTYVGEKIVRVFFKNPINRDDLIGYGKIRLFDDKYAEFIVKREEAIAKTQNLLARLPVDDLLIEEVEMEEVVRRIFQKGR